MAPFAGLSIGDQQRCLAAPAVPALVWGSVFTALHVYQGAQLSPPLLARNCGFIYAYGALQCPMEGLSQRQSLLHNGVALGALGGWGVQTGMFGIPFEHKLPSAAAALPRPYKACAVYGVIGTVLGALVGKPL